MRLFLSLLLIFAVTCVFFHQDVFTDRALSDTGHKTLRAIWADYENSKSEQKRHQGRVDKFKKERNRYINLANDLIGADNSSVASMHSIAVSALSSSYKDKIASRLGLTAQAVLNLFGSSSLESTIESFISTAKTNDDAAWSVYNNTNRTDDDDTYVEGYDRFDTANSAIEAWYENGLATDHYNNHVSPGEYLIGTPPPEDPGDIKWPSFNCPDGSCGLSWLLPSSARTAHFAKCGTKNDPYNKTLKGCNQVFYTCNTKKVFRHKPKDCGLERWKQTTDGWSKVACGSQYRNCTQNVQRHATPLRTNQRSMCGSAGSSSSNTVSPSATLSGSSSATAGGSVTVDVSTTTPYSSVWWYVAGPGDSGLGTHVETDTGSSSSTTDSFTYTFPSDASAGTWTITAYITNYSDQSVYQASWMVSVSSSSSSYTPPEPSYTPPSTTPALSAPSTVSCGRSACSASVSSRTEHRVPPCSACGKGYWTCGDYATYSANQHRVRVCRRAGCGNTWQRCISSTPDCNVASGKRCWAADP